MNASPKSPERQQRAVPNRPAIVVGTDGSATATTAVRRAATLARSQRAVLHLVTAYDSTLTRAQREELASMPESLRWRASPGENAERLLDQAVQAVHDALTDESGGSEGGRNETGRSRKAGGAGARRAPAAVKVERHARPGDPVDVLIEVAADVSAELVVVGNKGLQGLKGWVVPSVPSRVAHRAPCDVLIVDTHGRAA